MARRALAFALLAVVPANPASAAPPATPDYARAENWVCRPGVDLDGSCSAGLDAVALGPGGTRTPMPFAPAKDPPVDCFYVYPTASNDTAILSDLVPGEEKKSTHDQASRFASRCRLFAPIYHQITIAYLKRAMAESGDPAHIDIDIDLPYRDVLAAWRHYLAHDNKGRGVILIGHSQGALILTRLIAREIEGRPEHRRLVAAYLAGSLAIDSGSFRATPPCAAASQTGCFIAWSSYDADYKGPRLFGRANATWRPVCVDAARLDRGDGTVAAYLHAPPGSAAPWLYVTGRIAADCVSDPAGAAYRIAVRPGPDAAMLKAALPVSRAGPSWGLHPHDMELVQGNLLDLAATQSAAWLRANRAARKSVR